MFPKLSVLSVALSLILAGCASQQSLTEQTQPMQDRLVGLEQALKAANEQSKSRDEVLGMRIDNLAKAVRALVLGEGKQHGRTEELATRLDKAEALGASLAERATRSESRIDDLAIRGKASSTEAAQADRASDRLAERTAQAERRLDDLSGTLSARLAAAERRLDGLSASVGEALALATQENIRIHGKEAFSVQLTEDKTLYPLNSPELGSQDIAKLDDLVARLAALNQEYHLDIQGHTDNIGTEDYNYELGKARADVVKRYLSEKKGISLNRISVISYGASSPQDRAGNRNRRIAIRVLVLKQAH